MKENCTDCKKFKEIHIINYKSKVIYLCKKCKKNISYDLKDSSFKTNNLLNHLNKLLEKL